MEGITIYSEIFTKAFNAELKVLKFFQKDYIKDAATGEFKVPKYPIGPRVQKYNPKTGAELTEGSLEYIKCIADKDYVINEKIDGYEEKKLPNDIRIKRLIMAGESLARTKDKDALDELTKKENRTLYEDKTKITQENAYKTCLSMIRRMIKRGFKKSEMVLFVSADVETELLLDPRYGATSSNLSDKMREKGVKGTINDVEVAVIEYMEETYDIILFGKPWAQTFDTMAIPPHFVDLSSSGKYVGASALQAREVGGKKIMEQKAVLVKRNTDDN